ncbi:cell surface glycoprotein CD200 receptor 1 isoform X1 [Melanerpes formicivorus]|uniref:cell surface glycoprotein CD200 receptor 1 isoform X1 n=1 Tax=Melanerpes formicivorus TaxID=211600 RepID=UPI00358ED2BD
MKIAGKTLCVFVLLTITKAARTAGIKTVSVTVGNNSVLTCPPNSNVTMVTWKIMPKVGGACALGYRADQNKTDRTNCSGSMDWKFTPDCNPALEIQQVGITHEGKYICEVVTTDGNFDKKYHLIVLVPPRLTLSCDVEGNPVCEAAAGKPAAQISWVPESNSSPENKSHDNETVTVLSRFTAESTNLTTTTCIVSHLAGNQSKSITCHPSDNSNNLHIYIPLCFLSIIALLAVIYSFKLYSDRLCHKTKPPETDPVHFPEDDTTEVEPYTTYVQKENTVYCSVSDLTLGQNIPHGLSPAR